MEQAVLKSILLYAPRKGVFYWIIPPLCHAELLGEEAGSVTQTHSGKAYHHIQIDGVKHTGGSSTRTGTPSLIAQVMKFLSVRFQTE